MRSAALTTTVSTWAASRLTDDARIDVVTAFMIATTSVPMRAMAMTISTSEIPTSRRRMRTRRMTVER